MKAYGRKKEHPGNLPDNHPRKGWINWWEAEGNKGPCKRRERQKAKKDILKEKQNYGI